MHALPNDIREHLDALPWREREHYTTPYGQHHHHTLTLTDEHASDWWLIWRAHKDTLKALGIRMTRDPNDDWIVTREHHPRHHLNPTERVNTDQAFLDSLPWRDEGRQRHPTLGDARKASVPLSSTPGHGNAFWPLWNDRKDALLQAGYKLTKTNNEWILERYTSLTTDDLAADALALERSRAHDASIDLPTPPGYELLPYQRAGIQYALDRPRTLIADQMGLGKTIQALVATRASNGLPAIVIAPASLKLNWAREASIWLPEAQPLILDGRPNPDARDLITRGQNDKRIRKHLSFPDRRKTEPNELLAALTHPQRLLIINYDVIEAWLPILTQHTNTIKTAILDELHYCKEPKAKRTKAVRALVKHTPRVIGMTGTPILNRPKELLAQLEILGVAKELFGSGWNYLQRYTNATQTNFGWDFSGASNLDELQNILRSRVMVRRLKNDVLTELPPKRHHIVHVTPTSSVQRLIQRENEAHERNERTIARYHADVQRARQHGRKDEYERAVANLREAQRAAFTEMARLRHDVGTAKIPAITEYLNTALEAGEKVIAFAHHKDVIRALRDAFPDTSVVIDGSTPVPARQAAVDRFQNDPNTRLFIGNLIAAGVGITLTASSHVVFAEFDWTPGVLEQAEDRAHRIGQHHSVLITHLVWDGSLDARMATTVINKQRITQAALDTPTSTTTPTTTTDGALPTTPPHPTLPTSTTPGPTLHELRSTTTHPRATPNSLTQRRQQHLEHLIARRATSTPQPTTPITPERLNALHACLRYIADLDTDRASIQNGVGFNKADNSIGHHLADLDTLDPHTHGSVALALARTYHAQLPELLASAAQIHPNPPQREASQSHPTPQT